MKKRMDGRIRKAAALAVSLALVLCAALPAFAAGYDPVAGDAQHGFMQFLIVDSSAKIPAVEFEYSIAPGTAIPAAAGRMEVFAGAGQPSVGKAVFEEGEKTSTVETAGITLGGDSKYAVKTVNVDFSGVQFSEPGIYRYIVTMTSAGQQAVDYDVQKSEQATAKKRVLDVYVTDERGALKVDSYAFHELEDEVPAGAEGGSAGVSAQYGRLADKSEGFVNIYATQDLGFGKEVTGNQGSKDKYFTFTLSITGAAPGTTYYADLSLAGNEPGGGIIVMAERGAGDPAQFTTDENGAAELTYHLCDGQYVLVKGLPRGCGYALTEDKEDYVSTEGISAELSVDGSPFTDPLSGTIASSDIMTGFTNTRNGVVPTGVMMAAAPAAGVFVLGGAGLAAVIASKHRKNGEDEQAE